MLSRIRRQSKRASSSQLPIPIIWRKAEAGKQGPQTALNPEVYHARVWEPIFFFRKGKKVIVNSRPNLIEVPRVEHSPHPTEKPLELFMELAERSYVYGDVFYDPFAGTGTLGEVAFWFKAPCVLVEIDENHINLIKARMSDLEEVEKKLAVAAATESMMEEVEEEDTHPLTGSDHE